VICLTKVRSLTWAAQFCRKIPAACSRMHTSLTRNRAGAFQSSGVTRVRVHVNVAVEAIAVKDDDNDDRGTTTKNSSSSPTTRLSSLASPQRFNTQIHVPLNSYTIYSHTRPGCVAPLSLSLSSHWRTRGDNAPTQQRKKNAIIGAESALSFSLFFGSPLLATQLLFWHSHPSHCELSRLQPQHQTPPRVFAVWVAPHQVPLTSSVHACIRREAVSGAPPTHWDTFSFGREFSHAHNVLQRKESVHHVGRHARRARAGAHVPRRRVRRVRPAHVPRRARLRRRVLLR
jgi:hypothetical protein